MTLIVAQKHLKLPKSIALACCAILALSGNGLSAKAAETRSGNSRRTFADWCRQKADLSPEAQHTVEVLLEYAETTECEAADGKLSNLTQLDLENNKISDIKPLESLTNLTELRLNNQQISDIKPLKSLTNLTELGLNNNQISDIKPLKSLTNLIVLVLSGNPIAPKTCPIKPESICDWEPPRPPGPGYYLQEEPKALPSFLFPAPEPPPTRVVPTEVFETESQNRTFADWCRTQASLSPEAKHTVELLLQRAGTTECDAADQKLSSLTELTITGSRISNIKPFQSLTNLTGLYLQNNQISDIKPLQSLTKLTSLYLDYNEINDIKPLQSLLNLTGLDISGTQISDLKQLQSFTNLTGLKLENNQITDIKPLASLTNLTSLNLRNNQISDIKPLQFLTKLTRLFLDNNQINDIKS